MLDYPETTAVNSEPSTWNDEIYKLWDSTADGRPEGRVIYANYFTSRPYRNEYDRGSDKEGFTYTLIKESYSEHSVYLVYLKGV